jgi:hydrogenase maturation protease
MCFVPVHGEVGRVKHSSEIDGVRCLILACGNTLRSDDGVGPWLAAWAEEQFAADGDVRVISRQQWTPELAQEIATAEAVVFVDGAVDSAPGAVRVARVQPAAAAAGLATHHAGAAELLALSEELYSSLPRRALLLTVGAESMEMGETFSESVRDALPHACQTLKAAVLRLLATDGANSRPTD